MTPKRREVINLSWFFIHSYLTFFNRITCVRIRDRRQFVMSIMKTCISSGREEVPSRTRFFLLLLSFYFFFCPTLVT